MLNDFEDGSSFVGDQGVLIQRWAQEIEGLLELTEPLFPKPLFVQCITAEQMLAESPGRPDAELNAAMGFHPIANRNNSIQTIKDHGLIRRSNMHFLHITLFR